MVSAIVSIVVRAAVMREVGQPMVIENVDVDTPDSREVLVDVAASGLCHSDLRFLEGSFPHPLPAVLGHETAGVVMAVGKDVTGVSVGDHVIASLSVFCGDCAYCTGGRSNLCVGKLSTRRNPSGPPRLSIGGEPVAQFLDLSAFAEQMLVHENTLVTVPSDLPFDRAALLGCGVATGLGAVLNTAGVQPGESVAVVGCGGVGLSAVQGARIAGAAQIIAIDRKPAKLELALALGATNVVESSDPVGAVKILSGGLGVDHVIECVGTVATVELAFAMTAPGGTTTVVGLVPGGSKVEIPTDLLFYERKLQGSFMGSNDFKRDTPRYVDMYLDGQLNLDDMLTERMRLDEINEGFDLMVAGEAVRSLIVFD